MALANHYCHYAADFSFPGEAAQDLIGILRALHGHQYGGEPKLPDWYALKYDLLEDGSVSPEKLGDHVQDMYLDGVSFPDLSYDEQEGIFYFGEDGSFPADAIADVLADVKEEYGQREIVCFQVAYTSNRIESGNFGGETFAVGPGVVKSKSTGLLVDELARMVEQELAEQQDFVPKP